MSQVIVRITAALVILEYALLVKSLLVSLKVSLVSQLQESVEHVLQTLIVAMVRV